MTKSTITRERAQQIFLGNGPEPSASEERELARMALSAMDSEPEYLPLDYLQGQKTVWSGPPNWQKPITLRPETGCTMTLSNWQKLFAKVQICRQRSR